MVVKLGMFDWVTLDGVTCPKCGAELDNEFQTKDATQSLVDLHPGSVFKLYDGPDDNYHNKELRLRVYNLCDNCDGFVEIYIPLIRVTACMVMIPLDRDNWKISYEPGSE